VVVSALQPDTSERLYPALHKERSDF